MTEPLNTPISGYELLARNIYATSQYSEKSGLKKNRFYPNFRKESRDYPGRRVCRLSVQRLCHAQWKGAIEWALEWKGESQRLIGFEYAPAYVVMSHGFSCETAAWLRNPFHAHIYIEALDLEYSQPEEVVDEVMSSRLRRNIDDMASQFRFVRIEEISDETISPDYECDICQA